MVLPSILQAVKLNQFYQVSKTSKRESLRNSNKCLTLKAVLEIHNSKNLKLLKSDTTKAKAALRP
jgi:hypothetical protein